MKSVKKISNLKNVRYSDYENDLRSDGMLRDVWVFNASLSDWQTVLNVLTSKYRFDYTEDREKVIVVPSAKDIHHRKKDKGAMISFKIGTMVANSFFFCEDEIDFDFAHTDLSSETFPDLLQFMSLICQSINKEVVLTHEGNRNEVIFTIVP